jgi:hypothetical protein
VACRMHSLRQLLLWDQPAQMSIESAIVTSLSPSPHGALGLRWGMSRADVWKTLSPFVRKQVEPLGPRFFTTAVDLIADLPFFVGYRFSVGLIGVDLATYGAFPTISQVLSDRLGSPTRGPREDRDGTTSEWDISANAGLTVHSTPAKGSRPAGISISCALQGARIPSAPRPSTSAPELEELLDFDSIRRNQDAGFHAAASEAFADYRAALGMCPECGTVGTLSHSPCCSRAESLAACANCGRRVGVVSLTGETFCLLCAPLRIIARYSNAHPPELLVKKEQIHDDPDRIPWTPSDIDDLVFSLARTHKRTARTTRVILIAGALATFVLFSAKAYAYLPISILTAVAAGYLWLRSNRRYGLLWSCIRDARCAYRPETARKADLLSLNPRPDWLFGPHLVGRVVYSGDDDGVAEIIREPLDDEGLCFSFGEWFRVYRRERVRFDYFHGSPTVVAKEPTKSRADTPLASG